VLAEATDISMGVGDIGAILLIAILLIFSFVICCRLTGNLPGPTDGSNVRGFFWATAMLAQTAASACADWIVDPSGPSEHLSVAAIALGIVATIGLYLWTRMPRAVLFWYAFVLSGTGAALGGHAVGTSRCSSMPAPTAGYRYCLGLRYPQNCGGRSWSSSATPRPTPTTCVSTGSS
jgi:uncharacterized membrane-anchored protein